MAQITCIYAITNSVTGRRYIGSCVNFQSRRATHKWFLRKNRHWSSDLQADWNAYGDGSFSFDVIETVSDKSQLRIRERYWIDYYRSAESAHGYNQCKNATWIGMHHKESTKKKLSAARLGWEMPEWHKEILRQSASRPHPEWRCAKKRGDGNPNAKLTADDVAHIRERLAHGEKVSPIAKDYHVSYQAIWDIARGNSWQMGEEQQEGLSQNHR